MINNEISFKNRKVYIIHNLVKCIYSRNQGLKYERLCLKNYDYVVSIKLNINVYTKTRLLGTFCMRMI